MDKQGYLVKGVPDDLDIHLVQILKSDLTENLLKINIEQLPHTCSLMQDSKKGARGVSTSTALYSSAGVLSMYK